MNRLLANTLISAEKIKDFFKHIDEDEGRISAQLDLETLFFIQNITDVRTEAFKIQSFGRLIRHHKDDSVAELGIGLRALAKSIEDMIGELLFYLEMHEETLTQKQMSLKTQFTSEDVCQKAIVQFFKVSDDVNEYIDEIFNLLLSLEHQSIDLKKAYCKGLRKELKKIHYKITEEINPELLEDGTHKLRRLLRWVVMYFIYPEGLFKYTNQPAVVSPFLHLKTLSDIEPIAIEYSLLNQVSGYVKTLGTAKDQGLTDFYVHFIENKDAEMNESTQPIVELTEKIIREVKAQETILSLRELNLNL